MKEGLAQTGEELSARKRDLLRRVIDTYVREVHPVSSQLLAEEVSLSSATVRNELAALEEQGYLKQLHTSGGRVPTDRAYRFLVEELVSKLSGTLNQRARVSAVYQQLNVETEALLEGTLDLLTEMTGYVAWVTLPTNSALDIRSVNFVEVDKHEMLVVLVTGAGVMQSKMVRSSIPVKELALGALTDRLNQYLRGRKVLDVYYERLRRIFDEVVSVPESMIGALQDFFGSLAGGGERVFFGNALQLVLQPEFSRVENLASVLTALQDKERFISTLRRQLDERQIQTIIGMENSDPALSQCSLVLSRYSGPGGEGTLGVLGPTRQFYERTLSWVKVIGESVAQSLSEIGESKPEQ
jgi:heat-inducible transcriptional repressor